MAAVAQLRETSRFLEPDSRSRKLAAEARELLPDGITRETIRRVPYAPTMAAAYGSVLVDADGDERLDFLFNHTALLHGHTYAPVAEAVAVQARRLEAIPFPNEHEAGLARLLAGRVPVDEPYFRFTSSGSEAVLLALRLAAVATGRRKIVVFDQQLRLLHRHAQRTVVPAPLPLRAAPRRAITLSISHQTTLPLGS